MESENPLKYFYELSSLKIMLVLYRDNPDVALEDLGKESGLTQIELLQVLEKLINAGLVHVRSDGNGQVFTLSDNARMGLNRIGAHEKLMETA